MDSAIARRVLRLREWRDNGILTHSDYLSIVALLSRESDEERSPVRVISTAVPSAIPSTVPCAPLFDAQHRPSSVPRNSKGLADMGASMPRKRRSDAFPVPEPRSVKPRAGQESLHAPASVSGSVANFSCRVGLWKSVDICGSLWKSVALSVESVESVEFVSYSHFFS